jgi:hypothetical protein
MFEAMPKAMPDKISEPGLRLAQHPIQYTSQHHSLHASLHHSQHH